MPEITFGNILTMILAGGGAIASMVGIYIKLGNKISTNCMIIKNIKERVDGQGKAREVDIQGVRGEINDKFHMLEESRTTRIASCMVLDSQQREEMARINGLISDLFKERDDMNKRLQALIAWKEARRD